MGPSVVSTPRGDKMTINSETEQIMELFSILGRRESLTLLANSNLAERDQKLLALRFIKGLTLSECATYFYMRPNSIGKWQTKCCKSLYQWLMNRSRAEQILDALNMKNISYHISENIETTVKRTSMRVESILD